MCCTIDNFDQWIKGQKLTIRKVVIKEHILLGISEGLVVWLNEWNSENLNELGKLADKYALA